jgi:hypothetical protein
VQTAQHESRIRRIIFLLEAAMPMHFTTSSCNPAWEKRSKRPTPIRTTKSRGVFHGTPVERKIVAVLPVQFFVVP